MNATVRSSDPARPGWALPALAFAALVVAAYATPLFVRRNFSGRDLIAYNLPMEKSIHDAYARGRLPIWSPYVSGGRPLVPNPNAGALYPVRAAFVLARGAVRGPIAISWSPDGKQIAIVDGDAAGGTLAVIAPPK